MTRLIYVLKPLRATLGEKISGTMVHFFTFTKYIQFSTEILPNTKSKTKFHFKKKNLHTS